MVWQIPTKARPKLVKSVHAFFAAKGWSVKDFRRDARVDMIVTNREITYLLTVVDEAQKEFFSYGRMLDGIGHDSQEIRTQKHDTLIYITNFRFPAISFDDLVKQDIFVFALDEMDIIAGTVSYLDELPKNISDREMALFATNAKACLQIMDRFQKAGDRASAIKWGEHAIKLRHGVSAVHARLFRLYLEEEDLDNAERVGKEVFFFQPGNVEFLTLMERLSVQRNDLAGSAGYRDKRLAQKQKPLPPRSFDELIRKRQAQLPSTPAKEAGKSDEKVSKTIFSRLFGR